MAYGLAVRVHDDLIRYLEGLARPGVLAPGVFEAIVYAVCLAMD